MLCLVLHAARSNRNPLARLIDFAVHVLGLLHTPHTGRSGTPDSHPLMNTRFFEEQRREMIAAIRAMADHVAAELGKTALDERVLMAMAKVPRHEFVPIEVQQYAYLNRPIPIGFDKTISQPLMA